jgi:hypothetical protein
MKSGWKQRKHNRTSKTGKTFTAGIATKSDTIKLCVSNPTVQEAKTLTQDDVWGEFDDFSQKKISNGMIVARSGEICPIFKDKVPFKSVTVVCNKNQVPEVQYWLEYVHGGNSVSMMKQLNNGKVAIRSDYQCW